MGSCDRSGYRARRGGGAGRGSESGRGGCIDPLRGLCAPANRDPGGGGAFLLDQSRWHGAGAGLGQARGHRSSSLSEFDRILRLVARDGF
ncbi:hypothetical protein IMCC26134_08190 [Verrucomicrobia bacterium IMCC26134]|nr:hypothetical protein IMCC26134_08190 [Verrucomicrobia bacterium IMCC26134]